MVLQMSLLLALSTLSLVIAYAVAIFSTSISGAYVATIFLYGYLFFLIVLHPLSSWWNHDGRLKNWGLGWKIFIFISLVLGYALIYWSHNGLFYINGQPGVIWFVEWLFLSLSMFVNLGFWYITPTKEIALITALEALNGFIFLAYFISTLLPKWSEKIQMESEKYTQSLSTNRMEAKKPGLKNKKIKSSSPNWKNP